MGTQITRDDNGRSVRAHVSVDCGIVRIQTLSLGRQNWTTWYTLATAHQLAAQFPGGRCASALLALGGRS